MLSREECSEVADSITSKFDKMLTKKYTNSHKIVNGIIRQELERAISHRKGLDDPVCVCGDYKSQHENGVGRCKMPDDMCHGFAPCTQFRESRETLERVAREV